MNYQPLQTRSAVASAGIVFLVVANLVFDATGLMVDPAALEEATAWQMAGVMLLVGTVVAAILFLVWFNRAAKNLRALHPGAVFQFTSGWAVGWFFVPFANLVKPLQVMKEIYTWSEPDTVDGRSSAFMPPPAILSTWWATYILSGFVGNLSARLDDMQTSTLVGMASTGLSAVAAFCVITLMRTITANQEEAWDRRSKKPILSDTLKHAADVGFSDR